MKRPFMHRAIRFALYCLSISLLALLITPRAYAANPVIEMIEVVKAPAPNPALINATVTAQIKVHLKDPDVGNEVDPPAGTTFHWSCTDVVDNTAGKSNRDAASVSLSGGQTTTMTAIFFAPDSYTVKIHVEISNPTWKDANGNPAPPLAADTSLDVIVQIYSVTFSPGSIKTGYSIPATLLNIKTHVVATIHPISETQATDIVVQGQARVAISNETRDLNAGTLSFDVTGTSPTDKGAPNGDTTLVAQDNKDPKNILTGGSAQAIVIVPATCLEDYSRPVTVTNAFYPSGVHQPDNLPVPVTGQTRYYTKAVKDIIITVYDQFGAPLDGMYNGDNVLTESFPRSNGTVFSSSIAGPADSHFTNGTGLDEVVHAESFTLVDQGQVKDAMWVAFTMPTLGNDNNNHFNAIAGSMPNATPIQGYLDQTVGVAGFTLTPIWRRFLTWYDTDDVTNLFTVTESPLP